MSLAEWAKEHAGALKVIAQQRDADGPMADRALELVRSFIVKRSLILFGGLAIDYALRLSESRGIYHDDERPDFDVLSPNSVDDAYDLADELARAGFSDVGVVRGIHVQTMRVRTDYVWVADIGYAPRGVFEALPTLDYRGMRVMHPDYQRMDMHLAFCFPFSGAPREDVFHRWKKDLKRFNLLDPVYPVTGSGATLAEPALKTVTARLPVPIAAPSARGLGVALHGFAACAVLQDELARRRAPESAPASQHFRLLDAHSFEVEVPAACPGMAHFASPDPDSATRGLPDVVWTDPYMDVFPETAISESAAATVLSTRDRLLSVSTVRVGELEALVVTPQYLLLFFLFEAHRAPSEGLRRVYRDYYALTLKLLRDSEETFRDGSALAASLFGPSVQTLGKTNHNAAYLIKIAKIASDLGEGSADLLAGLPRGYYPSQGKARPPAFDYAASPFFQRAGARRAGAPPT